MIDASNDGFEPHWIRELDDDVYHGDKSSVSSTHLKKILKSPAAFHSSFFEEQKEDKDHFRFGRAFHMALLEPKKFESTYIATPDFGDLRTTAAKTAKKEWLGSVPEGATLLSSNEHKAMLGMIETVLKHKDASSILKRSEIELSGFYRDPGTGVKCRIRPDAFDPTLMTLLDVKTTTDCTRDEFARQIHKFGYGFQAAMYSEGIKHITGKPVQFAIVLAVERTAPFDCALYILDDKILYRGNAEYRHSLDTLKRCIDKNEWAPYQSELDTISLPPWVSPKPEFNQKLEENLEEVVQDPANGASDQH